MAEQVNKTPTIPKMSKKTILSRPRTRLYDVNYNMGESLYKPALDRLDRKYSGRPLSPPPRPASLAQDLLDRHERAFADEDINDFRRRAEKSISAKQFFDSRGARIDGFENDFADEVSSRSKSVRASKRVSMVDDVDMESTVNNLNSRRLLERSDKLLDSVGINDKALDENLSSFSRRALRMTQDDLVDSKDLTKWSAIKDKRSLVAESEDRDSAAALRMKQTKARLNDLEEEMEALAEKQAARERRAARLKQLVADTVPDDVESVAAVRKSVRIRAREVRENDSEF